MSEVAIGLVVVVAIAVIWVIWWLLKKENGLQTRLEALPGEMAEADSSLKTLQTKHDQLFSTDPDWEKGPAGEALVVYRTAGEEIQAASRLLSEAARQREQLQEMFISSKPLDIPGLYRLDAQLRNLLTRQAEVVAKRDAASKKLQDLGQGHEEVREVLKELGQVRDKNEELRSALTQRQLPLEPYKAAANAVEQQVRRADELVSADPVSALREARQALSAITELGNRLARVDAAASRAQALEERIGKATGRAAEMRAQGFLLTEPGYNPDLLLEQARQSVADAWQNLRGGDHAAANTLLDQGEAATADAEKAVGGQVEARGFCSTNIPIRRQEKAHLSPELDTARKAESVLSREFAPQSWADVRDRCSEAAASLLKFEEGVNEAQRLADAQHYFAARKLLEQMAGSQVEIHKRLIPVGQRLMELEKQRAQARALATDVEQAAAKTAAFLDQNAGMLRQPTREVFHTAAGQLQHAQAAMSAIPTDWQACLKFLNAAKEGYDRALSMAQKDMAT